jgi:hypothetical protein
VTQNDDAHGKGAVHEIRGVQLSSKIVKSVIGVTAIAAAVVALPATTASAATPCGISVTYGAWVYIPDSGGTHQRKWTWTFKNCGTTAMKYKVIVNNAPDSACFTIWPGTKTYSRFESKTPPFASIGGYDGTKSC